MTSTLGGQNIYISDDSRWKDRPNAGEIEPIGATSTTIHDAGMPSGRRTIVAWILENNYSAIRALVRARAAVNLTTADDGNEGNVFISSWDPQKVPALNYAYPVYRVTFELIEQ